LAHFTLALFTVGSFYLALFTLALFAWLFLHGTENIVFSQNRKEVA
jgi:hypothetical protein